jgi:AraC-like DNA-binding protein
MVATYTYRLPAKFDPYYLRAILQREFGVNFLGWSETLNEIRIDFARELTADEKSKLDSLIANPPMPAAVYEFGAIDLADEIEKAIGVRPVLVDYDEATDRGRIMFDKALTSTQEAALQTFIQGLRTKRIFKRRS